MDINYFNKIAADYVNNSELNYIKKDSGLSNNVVELKIFDEPIFGFSSVDDENYTLMKNDSVIGEHFLLPDYWLPNSKTVISIFLPFTKMLRNSNSIERMWPSEGWVQGYNEGQALVKELSLFLASELINEGYISLIPSIDKRFWTQKIPASNSLHPNVTYTSNWSERHVAFISGLGTFGLSKGIITKKGMAGRLSSIITELYIPPTEREYTDIYEYCIMCGSCAINCPNEAISVLDGKNHNKCSSYLDTTAEKIGRRAGCGKCQVSVPCESKIP